MADDAVVGVTSNPTIFQKALAEGDLYDAQLREVAATTDDAVEIFFALAMDDIREACDLMRPVWERTDGVDGFVSLEVDPTLAYERERPSSRRCGSARRSTARTSTSRSRPPSPGLGAIEDCIAKGVSINVTLIFSLERYAAVAEAYLRGLERLVAVGRRSRARCSRSRASSSRASTPRPTSGSRRSVARDLQGKLAVANAKLAYQHYLDVFGDDRWAYLAGKGARPQRCLWASTSAKNPAYRDVIYVEELIGPDTVNTMPLETVRAFQEHGEVKRGQPHGTGSTRPTRCSPTSPRRASTTTTSSRRSRRRACRSSPTRSPSCSTASAPRWARWRRRDATPPTRCSRGCSCGGGPRRARS